MSQPQRPEPTTLVDEQETITTGAARLVGEIRRTLRGLVVATVLLYIALGAVAGYGYIVSHNNQVAVCRLEEDLSQRIAASKNFLIEHPRGFPQLGVSRAQILTEIEHSERTRDALSIVSC